MTFTASDMDVESGVDLHMPHPTPPHSWSFSALRGHVQGLCRLIRAEAVFKVTQFKALKGFKAQCQHFKLDPQINWKPVQLS